MIDLTSLAVALELPSTTISGDQSYESNEARVSSPILYFTPFENNFNDWKLSVVRLFGV